MKALLGSLVRKAKCVGDRAAPALARTRLALCRRCPELRTDDTCAQCGCYMPAKVTCLQERTRAGVKAVVCPLGRW